jgi:hypothetical protein
MATSNQPAGLIDAELMRVVAAFDLLVQKSLLRVPANFLQPRHSVNNVHRKAETVDVVVNRQLQRHIDTAFLLVAAHADVFVVPLPIRQPMNQLRVAVEVEDDRLVHGKQRIKIAVSEAVRMLSIWAGA